MEDTGRKQRNGGTEPAARQPLRRDLPPPHRGQGGSLRLEPRYPSAVAQNRISDHSPIGGDPQPEHRMGTIPRDPESNLSGIIPPGIERVVGVPADNSILIHGTREAV